MQVHYRGALGSGIREYRDSDKIKYHRVTSKVDDWLDFFMVTSSYIWNVNCKSVMEGYRFASNMV